MHSVYLYCGVYWGEGALFFVVGFFWGVGGWGVEWRLRPVLKKLFKEINKDLNYCVLKYLDGNDIFFCNQMTLRILHLYYDVFLILSIYVYFDDCFKHVLKLHVGE